MEIETLLKRKKRYLHGQVTIAIHPSHPRNKLRTKRLGKEVALKKKKRTNPDELVQVFFHGNLSDYT